MLQEDRDMETWILILAFLAAMGMVHWCQKVLHHLTFICSSLERIADRMGDSTRDALKQAEEQQIS